MARGPDIIQNQSIPLSATSDAPVLDVPRPPVSASNDPVDLQTGVPKEITAAELAVAAAARKGDPATADLNEEGKPKTTTTVEAEADEGIAKPRAAKKVEADDPIIADVPKESPDWYRREVASIRRAEREKTAAAFAAAKAQVGDAAWDAALDATRDKVVGEAKAEAAKALKETREARDAIAARDAELAELRAKVPVIEEKPAVDLRPTRDQFDDPDEYDNALTAWGEREGERKITARAAAEQADAQRLAEEASQRETLEAHAAAEKQIVDTWNESRAKAIERYPDFVDLVEKEASEGGPTITSAMTAAILNTENGTEVAYFLGQNVDESVRIAGLSTPLKQIMEIGRIAERLANPPRRARPAPPIEPIDGTGNEADTSEREPTMEEYAATRLPQLRAARRPFFGESNIH